ncbi:arsenate reductase (glutaredoxin) [Thiomicrorhabdus sp.]|uniref:arsenate reductase (glutaredoxin) n=1 Tax=Thiomicrorhabdus sp. TaxID=2039724 RepID=UPI0029C7A7E4|nr:arsenate reductase (glutaredoxin) [Thiomicrorhabdus sp.]
MKTVTLYHNPRCSKSRESYKLLQEKFQDSEIEEIRYLEKTPDLATLQQLCKMLEMQPSELVRKKEALYKELGLHTRNDIDEQEWLEILTQNPKLIERPIIVIGSKAVLGRPPENIHKLLNE